MILLYELCDDCEKNVYFKHQLFISLLQIPFVYIVMFLHIEQSEEWWKNFIVMYKTCGIVQ